MLSHFQLKFVFFISPLNCLDRLFSGCCQAVSLTSSAVNVQRACSQALHEWKGYSSSSHAAVRSWDQRWWKHPHRLAPNYLVFWMLSGSLTCIFAMNVQRTCSSGGNAWVEGAAVIMGSCRQILMDDDEFTFFVSPPTALDFSNPHVVRKSHSHTCNEYAACIAAQMALHEWRGRQSSCDAAVEYRWTMSRDVLSSKPVAALFDCGSLFNALDSIWRVLSWHYPWLCLVNGLILFVRW